MDNAVQDYITRVKGLPFFYIVGDDNYTAVLSELREMGLSVVSLSDFCPKADKFPSIEDLIDYFRTSDVDYKSNKSVVVGLGEYLALRGADYAVQELKHLKNTTLGNARVILLLRGVTQQAKAVIDDDNKMMEQGRAYIAPQHSSDLSVINVRLQPDTNVSGVKDLLKSFESGKKECQCSSQLIFDKSIIPITSISTSYGLFCYYSHVNEFKESYGSASQWDKLLEEYKKNRNDLAKVFSKYGIDEDYYQSFYSLASGLELKNWLFFLYLKSNVKSIKDEYLRYVVEKTEDYSKFKSNILLSICDFKHTDNEFWALYQSRKRLVKEFPETDIASFVQGNEIDAQECIYRLTDNTKLEKKAIIRWISQNGLNDAISTVYPDLSAYLGNYSFEAGAFSEELTSYFNHYRTQKVTNHIDDAFFAKVEEYSHSAKYAKLPTRDSAIQSISDKKNAYLYWIDALGVEYLPFITAQAKSKGLSLHVETTRCDLPTLTDINKGFYENWTGTNKYKESRLDDIKHHEEGGYFYTEDKTPIHLAAELDVIKEAIDRAAMELSLHNCKSFVIASDHGASRLAVIAEKTEKYETDTKGLHSGRCCKYFDGCDLENAEKENDFLVLKDYGRFSGSRKANVEVHGGALLEEIVVPVITFTLKNQTDIKIVVTNDGSIVIDKVNGTRIDLYVSDALDGKLNIVCNESRVYAQQVDSKHYFALIDVKRAKEYSADVYDDDNLIGNIKFTVKGKTGSKNNDFDDLF